MLLNFTAENFKSFAQRLEFSMHPDGISELKTSVLHEKADGKTCSALCSAVIYGANGAGKTNIVNALDTLKKIVQRGHLHNMPEDGCLNSAAYHLELIPGFYQPGRPVRFSIRFTAENNEIQYELDLHIESLSDKKKARQVLREKLTVNDKEIYLRSLNNLILGKPQALRSWVTPDVLENTALLKKMALQSLKEDELFLTNGFGYLFSSRLAHIVTGWFENQLKVFYPGDYVRDFSQTEHWIPLENQQSVRILEDEDISQIAKNFGAHCERIVLVLSDGVQPPRFMAAFQDEEKTILHKVEDVESYGTARLLAYLSIVTKAINEGATLVIDEFDNSLHPQALRSIASLFHDPNINTKNAQLIIDSHNPVFLDAALFRRDEIRFVEYRKKDKTSICYSLSDFGTSNKSGVRKGEAYQTNYFQGKYGGIEEVNFTESFAGMIRSFHKNTAEQEEAQNG